MMSKYINALGRFDLESLKIDLTTYMGERKAFEEARTALETMTVGQRCISIIYEFDLLLNGF